jgi:Rieske Fe-S protein
MEGATEGADRRKFLSQAATAAMTASLAASYGTAALMAARFLFPARSRPTGWMFVIEADRLAPGDSYAYRSPAGERIAIARQDSLGTAADFVALGSTCPHLGCQVHWEAQNERFFCPCHNGAFDRSGRGIAGPPGEAGQWLPRFELKLEGDRLFIRVPLEALPSPSRSA